MQRSISPYERYGAATPIEDAVLQTHVFTAGQTISGIAEKFFGDWQKWRIIAERNKIIDVRKIEPGTVLIIPNAPLETGNFDID